MKQLLDRISAIAPVRIGELVICSYAIKAIRFLPASGGFSEQVWIFTESQAHRFRRGELGYEDACEVHKAMMGVARRLVVDDAPNGEDLADTLDGHPALLSPPRSAVEFPPDDDELSALVRDFNPKTL